MSTDYAIRAEGLHKHFKKTHALRGLDLHVPKGQVLGLLGPNGAGKTTAVRIFATLLKADEGIAEVGGVDTSKDPDKIRSMIGLTGQYAAVDEHLTGFENLKMVGRLYHLKPSFVKRRANELLERFDLAESGSRSTKTYSGGMRRRLDLAASIIAFPQVIFLDEPTTGLDPRSRQGMWEVISELVSGGATVLLTTQYLEEADRLADNIAVIDHGTVIAEGTADSLKSQVGGERIELTVSDGGSVQDASHVLERFGDNTQVDASRRQVTVSVTKGAQMLPEIVKALGDASVPIDDFGLRRPTLDDVFLTLTGRAAEQDAQASESQLEESK